MKFLRIVPSILVILLSAAFAQSAFAQSGGQESPDKAKAQANPVSGFNKFAYGRVQSIVLLSAQKMPEENYNFKPTYALRSFGQVLGHVADAQYMFCSKALGEKDPAPGIQKTKTSKADLIAALKDAFAYCDKAYDSMTDASGTQTVKLMGMELPKLSVLNVNILHMMEHYGNLSIYMRLKNIIPPSSEPQAMAPPPKP